MRIVQCHGCFDLLHLGHIRHFQAARAAGDYLIVTVTPDRFVNKGAGRPVFSEAQRLEAIAAIGCVDDVRLTEGPTAADAIRQIRPAVFAKGPDYSAETLDREEALALAEVGAELLITQTEKWSSTALLTPARGHSDEVEQYLHSIRAKYSAADVLGWLEQARALNVLVVGEQIIDEYRYCNVLGKAGKEPIMAAQELRSESFDGGALAVAKHVEACSDSVDHLTGPPIVKTRFIESYPFQKLFETYDMDEALQARAAEGHLLVGIGDYDLTIVADYGHGFLTPALRKRLAETPYLAINVQANAGNHGFNTISKYGLANFISLSERELRLNARDQTTDVRTLMRHASIVHDAMVLITRGEHGGMLSFGSGYIEAPALASHAVDRMGAGDAVFAVTACCAAVGMPAPLLAFIAAVVGTLAVAIVGNARYIEREALHQAIQTWLR